MPVLVNFLMPSLILNISRSYLLIITIAFSFAKVFLVKDRRGLEHLRKVSRECTESIFHCWNKLKQFNWLLEAWTVFIRKVCE